MNITITEQEELQEMKENIRRSIQCLELCLDCECISECELIPIDDGSPVWLCQKCTTRLQKERGQCMGRLDF
jgi:hypothetical protein